MSIEVVGIALVVAISVVSVLMTRRLAMAYVRTKSGAFVGLTCLYVLSSMFALSYVVASLVGVTPDSGVGVVCITWAGYLLGYFFYSAYKQPTR